MTNKSKKNDLTIEQNLHIKILQEKVFEINKYPSFSLLIDGLIYILDKFDKNNSHICILERTKLYGSSLFGGLFNYSKITSFDCSPSSAEERGSYNSFMINHSGFIKFDEINSLNQDQNFNLPSDTYDAIFIPNLVHHFKDQNILFSKCQKSLKKNGELVIFEPTFREIHQAPHDYIRYTPYGIEQILRNFSFRDIRCLENGDGFEALNYILNIMEAKRKDQEFINWCNELKTNIDNFKIGKKDIVKSHARFPTSFLSIGVK
tara:strand:- start:929 stop:1714 length:786 start_codon:yes stop_codon:yes gene_type:complete